MNQELTRQEKGRIRSALILALAAALMVVLPLLLLLVLARCWGEPELPGLAGFALLIGLPLMVGGAFSAVTSLIMLVVTALANRRALKTGGGITSVILDVGVLVYIAFVVIVIARRWK